MGNLLGLDVFYSPELDEDSNIAKKIIDEYTIWELKEYGLGYNICKLNNFIFEKFKENIKREYAKNQLWDCFRFIFPNHKDLEKDYFDYINRKLISWKIPDYIDTYETGGSGRPYWYCGYLIDGVYLMESYKIPSHSNKSVVLDKQFLPKTLLDFLDDISPGLFLGKIKPENLMLEQDSRID